ncbi:hypothetical protein MMC28_011061 [Mycoblastus sanguinarius]|nr:hypothetical protein [Mycoblastus sanguinarius]
MASNPVAHLEVSPEANKVPSDQHLHQLLQQCPDTASATSELKRLSEHAFDSNTYHETQLAPNTRLAQYVDRRSQGEPLEYILGSTPWAGLDILCRSGTLIPRESSEIVASIFARTLAQLQSEGVTKPAVPVRIADIGTGTGCVSLLLHKSLHPPESTGASGQSLEILGGDISSDCLKLASDSLEHSVRLGAVSSSARDDISFQYLDMIKLGEAVSQLDNQITPSTIKTSDATSMSFLDHKWDAMISYPPCVPAADFLPGGRVPYTDRTYQPKVAIVPPILADEAMQELEVDPADVFFYILLKVALKADVKVTVLEVCEGPQATRVRKLAAQLMPSDAWIERWRDETVFAGDGLAESDFVDVNDDAVRGRAVVVWMGDWAEWRRKNQSNVA